jgi:hypothetical protein
MQNNIKMPNLVCFNKWLNQIGVTSTTGWRWRKRGVLRTTNIYGRLYISEAAIAEFLRRANDGEFAITTQPKRRVFSN